MKKILIIILVAVVFSCKSSNPKYEINPEARKLNDSAMSLVYASSMPFETKSYQKAIKLIDKAIQIDSNYFTAYWNKRAFQSALKQYDSVLLTTREIIRLRPNDAMMWLTTGEIYERQGDSVSANRYYAKSFSILNNQLDTISTKNKQYRLLKLNRAIALILLNQQKKGDNILKDLYNKETDPNQKQQYLDFMNMNRHEVTYGKEVTATAY